MALSAFAELAVALRWEGDDVVVTLCAYFDESGHPQDPNVHAFSLAGCVATVDAWSDFCCQWQDALSKEGVTWFHMTEFEAYTGEFEGWTEGRHRDFLGTLMRIITSHIRTYVGSAWRLDSPTTRGDVKWHYNLEYRTCIRHSALTADRTVNFVFADHEEISGAAYHAFHVLHRKALVGTGADPRLERIGSLDFHRPKRMPPLQAADLIAYELREQASGFLNRWPFKQLPTDRCRFFIKN